MRAKKYYIVPVVRETAAVALGPWKQTLTFKDMEDGCCGVFEAYTNKKKCLKRMKELGIE